MYSTGQRKLAIETYIKFDLSAADTVAELGYPTRHSLRAWYKDYLEHGEVRPPKRQREPKFTLEMRQAAVDYYLAHGKSLALATSASSRSSVPSRLALPSCSTSCAVCQNLTG